MSEYIKSYAPNPKTIRIGEYDVPLPVQPPLEEMINFGVRRRQQIFERTKVPKGLKRQDERDQRKFIQNEWHKRRNGVWYLINGKPVYLTGPAYVFFNYWPVESGAIATDEGVGTWQDLSGNGRHVTQTTNTDRPVYKATGGPGSKPCIQFDGSDDWLASAAHFWGSDDITVIVVMKFANATRDASECVVGKWLSTPTNNRQWLLYGVNAAGGYRNQFNTSVDGSASASWNSSSSTKHTNYKLRTVISDGSDADMYDDGGEITATNDVTSNIYNSSTAGVSIGALNVSSTPTFFASISISEVMVWAKPLSATERAAIETYLNRKYDLYTPTPEYVNTHLDVDSDSLFYWFAADRDVTDSLGGTISNNEGVGNWGNLAPNAVPDVAQTTNTARPVWKATGGPNNKPCIQFDGSNDFLAEVTASFGGSDDMTVIMVMKYANATRNATEQIIGRRTVTPNYYWNIYGTTSASTYRESFQVFPNGDLTAYCSVTTGINFKHITWKIKSWTSTGTDAFSLFSDGSSITISDTEVGASSGTIANSTTITRIGSANGVGEFLQGAISEIMVFSKNLSDATRKKYEYYLSQKYGITIQL